MKNICIVAPELECLIYTIAKAIASENHCVYVLTHPKDKIPLQSHTFYYQLIERIKNVSVINEFPATKWEWIYFPIMPQLTQLNLKYISNYAQNIGIISSYDKSAYMRTLWHEFKEFIKYFDITSKAKNVLFTDGFYSLDIYSLTSAKKEVFGFDVHANFLDDDNLNHKMFSFDWYPLEYREYKLNFIGNINPTSRTQIIQEIKSYLDAKKQYHQTNSNQAIIWIEYGDEPGKPRGVPAIEYINYLVKSDFTLCPPGYLRLTHRVVEALVKGSIPILHDEELFLYDINLQDKINCIAVKNGDWNTAIETAINMNNSEIHTMRNNILSMKDTFLTERAFSTRLCQKMGLL